MEEKAPLLSERLPIPVKKGSKVSYFGYFLIATSVVVITLTVAVCATAIYLAIKDKFAATGLSVKTFKAGAFEQKIVTVYNATTRSEALVAMKANLANMEIQAEIARREVSARE